MKLSVVLPLYNEEELVDALYRSLRSSLERLGPEYELIFVDDGSVDRTLPALLNLANADGRVTVIELTRNFGNQVAIATGLEFATGQWVVTMDSDLEDRPEDIEKLYGKAQEGYDVVYAVRGSEQKPLLKNIGSRFFYSLINRISTISLPQNAGNFCIMRQEVVDALRRLPERNRYLTGLRAWVGFTQTGLELPRGRRIAGSPKQSFARLLKHALDAIFSFSTAPLKLLTMLGTLAFLFALFFAGVVIVFRLTYPHVPVGWASTMVVIIFVGGLQLIGLGILGEYLARVFDEVRARPMSLVRKVTHAASDTRISQ